MKGISHITFLVRDLDRIAVFLCQGLGHHLFELHARTLDERLTRYAAGGVGAPAEG